ncbi:MAG: protein kinase domain-containing protein [Phototrophicaceae bacterium]
MSDQRSTRYTLLNRIGDGGEGMVYLAKDHYLNRQVALKKIQAFSTLHSGLLTEQHSNPSQQMRIRLANEFRTLASLSHPNIIHVLDYGFDLGGNPYFTMDYLQDAVPFNLAAANRNFADKIQLIGQLFQALSYLHRHQIVHRDLKPSNVLVTPSDRVIVLDFGLASRVGKPGETAGTILYMAPEVLSGEEITVSSDLYSAGAMAYELFTGSPPFKGGSVHQIIANIMRFAPDLTGIMAFDEEHKTGLATVLSWLLAKNSTDRYNGAEAARQALYKAANLNAPVESQTIRESIVRRAPFVGRREEFKQLLSAFQAASNGKGSNWLIGGESGVGKTRFLEELRTQALVRGFNVLQGEAIENQPSAYPFWRNILRQLMLTVKLPPTDAAALVTLLPYLQGDVKQTKKRKIHPEEVKNRLESLLGQLFERIHDPTLLIIEDVQWLPESASIIRTLNKISPHLPLVILVSYRNDENPYLYGKYPLMQFIPLKRLTLEELHELSQSILGQEVTSEQIITFVEHQSEGNPFFAVETLLRLSEDAGSINDLNRLTLLADDMVVDRIMRLVERRMAKVPFDYRPILRLAAVMGRQLDFDLLRYVDDEMDYEDWLTVIADAQLLEVRAGEWQFNHEKIRQGILYGLDPEERKKLHRLAAQAMEEVHHEDYEVYPTISQHWLNSGDFYKSLYYLQLSFQHTLLYVNPQLGYQIAQLLLASLPPNTQDLERATLYNLLGDSNEVLGNYPEARRHYLESIQAWRQIGQTKGLANATSGLSTVLQRMGERARARTLMRQALRIYRRVDDALGEAKTLQKMGYLAYVEADYEEALNSYLQSSALAHSLQLPELVASAAEGLGFTMIYQAHYGTALDWFDEAENAYKEAGLERGLGMVMLGRGLAAQFQADYAGARAFLEGAMEQLQAVNYQYGYAIALMNLSAVLTRLGEYEQALGYRQEGIALAETMEISTLRASFHFYTSIAHSLLGEFDPARHQLQKGLNVAHGLKLEWLWLEGVLSAAALSLALGNPLQASYWMQFVKSAKGAEPNHDNEIEFLLSKLPDGMGLQSSPHPLTLNEILYSIRKGLLAGMG